MTSNFFLFLNVIPTSTSIEYINLHEFYIPFCLSFLRKYENSLDYPPLTLLLVKTRHTRRDEERFHADDGGKMDRVCCRRGKYE